MVHAAPGGEPRSGHGRYPPRTMAEQGRRWRAWRQPGAWSLTGYPAPGRVAPGPTGTVRVVIVDDSAEVRTLVRTKLRLSGAAVVEGEGADGADAVDLARRLQPDAMLLDVSMPGMDGLEALPQVLEGSPGTRVVMFSGFDEEPLAHAGPRARRRRRTSPRPRRSTTWSTSWWVSSPRTTRPWATDRGRVVARRPQTLPGPTRPMPTLLRGRSRTRSSGSRTCSTTPRSAWPP